MSKHTPGPWLIDGTEDGFTFVYALNQQGYNRMSAHVQSGYISPMEKASIKEMEANARLIAAAPDLLESLKDAYPHIGDDALRARIGAVICKAEGV